MAQLLSVARSDWRSFFDRMSKALLGKRAEIEVAALDRFDHLIRHPKEILVEEDETGLAMVAVVDGEGVRQVIRLKESLMLRPRPWRADGLRGPRASFLGPRSVPRISFLEARGTRHGPRHEQPGTARGPRHESRGTTRKNDAATAALAGLIRHAAP